MDSPLGLFVRRASLHFKNMSFTEFGRLYDCFEVYSQHSLRFHSTPSFERIPIPSTASPVSSPSHSCKRTLFMAFSEEKNASKSRLVNEEHEEKRVGDKPENENWDDEDDHHDDLSVLEGILNMNHTEESECQYLCEWNIDRWIDGIISKLESTFIFLFSLKKQIISCITDQLSYQCKPFIFPF